MPPRVHLGGCLPSLLVPKVSTPGMKPAAGGLLASELFVDRSYWTVVIDRALDRVLADDAECLFGICGPH